MPKVILASTALFWLFLCARPRENRVLRKFRQLQRPVALDERPNPSLSFRGRLRCLKLLVHPHFRNEIKIGWDRS